MDNDVIEKGEDVGAAVSGVVSKLNFSFSEALDILEPVAVLLGEILLYALFVYVFYQFLARRDIVTAGYSQYAGKAYQISKSVFYLVKHMLVFPIIVVAWTGALVVILSLLSGEEKSIQIENILLIAVSLISTIRVSAYIREDLSKDLAKMLPFAILGIYLVDKDYYSLEVSEGVIRDLPDHWEVIVYYTVFVVVLEIVMRLFHGITSPVKLGTPPPQQKPASQQIVVESTPLAQDQPIIEKPKPGGVC